jgi:hypothetical protein
MSSILAVQLEAVDELAAELVALAAELAGDAELCRSTAASLQAALEGDEGATAAAAAGAWGALTGAVADRTAAIAGTLRAAVVAYRSADEAFAERIGSSRTAPVAVAR